MAGLEATGALEELVRQQRSLVDQTLYPLLEDAPLGDLLQHFQSTLLALQSQEPSFWQLQVVEFIRNFLKTRVGGCVRDAVRSAASGELQDPEQVVAGVRARVETSSELEDALRQLRSDVEGEVNRLTELLSAGKENRRRFEGTDDHFLDQFWSKLQKLADTRELQPKSDEEREAEEVEESESCSFEIFTFDDDLNDVSRSAVSFPCMEDFPGTIMRMQSTDALERSTGLDELMQMPIVEIIHSGPIFPAACSAVVGLFLDMDDIRGVRCDTAERAKRVIFDLMNQVEDAAQFLELYGAILEFMGLNLETGKLYLDRQSIFESTDAHTIAVLDCFRVLHALICQVTRHWVYFSADALARMMYSTFYILTMYSKTKTEVEAKRVSPLLMMSLIDDCPMQWFRLWLLNCPSTRQLFVAMEESGFIADLLQYMSRVRPLALRKLSTPSTDAIEKRAVQSALIVLSYMCEYQEGRELLSRWKRVSAHAFIQQRHTSWGRPALETIAAENDSLFRSVQPETVCQDQQEELDADYEHLGAGAVDALILSIASVIVTLPIHSQEIVYAPYDEKWANAISNSAATYLHAAHGGDLTAVLVKIIDSGWMHSSPSDYSTTELEEKNPWFPFRQPKGATEICQLVVDSVSKRNRSGALSNLSVRLAGLLILVIMLQSKTMTDSKTSTPSAKLIFDSCKRVLQSWGKETWSPTERLVCGSYHSKLLALITDLTSIPQAFRVAHEVGVVDELWKPCNVLPTQDHEQNLRHCSGHIVGALCHSVTGIRYVHDTPILNIYFLEVNDQWRQFATGNFRELLCCLAAPASAKAFFSLDGVQSTIFRIIAEFQESADFTVAINSPEHECPLQLTHLVLRLRLLQCCLSTQYASSSLLLTATEWSPLVQFIAKTLTSHVKGDCMRSCHAEDTCCVAFLLVLSLVSSVPALLNCGGFLADLQLLNLDAKSSQQRDVLCGDSELLGSCSLLEKQLRYAFEFVGGSNERILRCELYAFDGHSRQNGSIDTTHVKEPAIKEASDFIITLQSKILQALQDDIKTGSSVPMDFVLISQASWEMINDLETKSVVSTSFGPHRSAASFTEVFAKLMYKLITSNRSRVEVSANSTDVDELDANAVTSSGQDFAEFFPTDSERKLMNRLYKNYASGLSLDSSPTLLHCLVKKFGKVAMDCFPVTMLMILYPTYGEADILQFLSHCLTSPSGCFLWPRSAATRGGEIDAGNVVSPAMLIAEGVEIIMEREFPLVLRVIDQCQCSLLSLVLRWHSQSFWNYFDWENIVIYTYFSILYGAEFQVYIIVAILKHLEPTMRDLTASHNTQSLLPFLTLIQEPIRNFRFSQWRALLLRLRSEYNEEVRAILLSHKTEQERT